MLTYIIYINVASNECFTVCMAQIPWEQPEKAPWAIMSLLTRYLNQDKTPQAEVITLNYELLKSTI